MIDGGAALSIITARNMDFMLFLLKPPSVGIFLRAGNFTARLILLQHIRISAYERHEKREKPFRVIRVFRGQKTKLVEAEFNSLLLHDGNS